MISKNKPRECFVYITLPGETKFVTAGRFQLTTDRNDIPTGKFIYGKSYLERKEAVEIDPSILKLDSKICETNMLKGIFGALRDASPDYWGRRVIEKHAGKPQLEEIDYLLYSRDDRAGALGFGLGQKPPAPLRKFNKTLELENLQKIADAIIADEEFPKGEEENVAQVNDLMLIGTAMGGARPKTVVEDEHGLWIAKLNRNDDRWNNVRVEHAMLKLAHECGLNTSESKLEKIGDRDVLLMKRFDREKVKNGYRKARMISALTILRTEDTYLDREKWSYVLLVEELRRISAQSKDDANELFKRMCFNAMISNIDDHPRNHAVIAMDMEWKLSPAYDLTPATPISIERRDLALICGDNGRYAHINNLLSQCERFLLKEDEAKYVIDKMEETVRKNWYKIARREGVTEKDCDTIQSAFVYPGFRLALA